MKLGRGIRNWVSDWLAFIAWGGLRLGESEANSEESE